MNSDSVTTAIAKRPRTPWLVIGTLVAGAFDILFAMTFWALKANVPPTRILQSVAAGLLGEASFRGGNATALLGLVLHYLIMSAMLLTFYLVARRLATLQQRPFLFGTLYGLALFAVMNFMVLPLSAADAGPDDTWWIACSVIVHAIVGVLCAWFSRRALRAS